MAKAMLVKAARKDYPDHGIKKGESYYWWKFRFGGKHFSKTPPKPSQLTGSEFLGTVYGLQEAVELWDAKNMEALKGDRDEMVDEIRALGEEQGDKKSNMPDGLQEGEVGQLLESRAEACDDWANELEAVDLDIEREEGESDDEFQSRCDDALSELSGCEYQGE